MGLIWKSFVASIDGWMGKERRGKRLFTHMMQSKHKQVDVARLFPLLKVPTSELSIFLSLFSGTGFGYSIGSLLLFIQLNVNNINIKL